MKAEAYVEYYLKVQVGKKANSSFPKVATIPIEFKAQSISISRPIGQKQVRQIPVTIKTLKFLPENAEAGLSKGKQLKGFFQPSSVPQYSFTVKVRYPTMIQLDHVQPIYFGISLTPEFTRPKTTIDIGPEGLPKVRVTSISLLLRSTTQIRAPAILGYTTSDKHHEYPIHFPSSNQTAKDSIIPANSTFVDFGTKLNLRLTRTHSSALKTYKSAQFERPLTASFATYNISLQYEFRWRIEIECAGETQSLSNHGSPGQCIVLAGVKEEESKWVGKERGTDYDGVVNTALSIAKGVTAVLGAVQGG
jgi:hypothetical protein